MENLRRIYVIAESSGDLGSSSCQNSTILIGQEKGTMRIVVQNQKKVKTYAKKFSQGYWMFLGPGDEKEWHGKSKYPPEEKWESVASQMVQRFKETGHPVFTSASALSRGILRTLKGKETIRFNADASNTELLFRIVRSVNQLSIYGAVSNWCAQFDLTKERDKKELSKKETP